MAIGRNDPCPCGSGKKYKKCHGMERAAAAEPEVARAHVWKDRDIELVKRIMRFARQRHGPEWLQDVLDDEGLLDESGNLSDAEPPIVIPWLMHYRKDEAGLTISEEWRHHEGDRIADDDRLLLDAYKGGWVSLWEVAEVQAGTGSRIIDALTHEERFVHDVSTSKSLKRFDTVLAIVPHCDGVSFFGGIHGLSLPPRFAADVFAAARREFGVRTRAVSPEKLQEPEAQLYLLDLWNAAHEAMRNQPPPRLQNTDGDPLVLTRDDFALEADRETIARQLLTLPGVQEPEEEADGTVFTVTRSGNQAHKSWDNTVIGRIVLTDTRLTVETNSTRRADSLRSAVEGQLHDLVRFRLRKEENTTQMMAELRESSAPKQRPDYAPPPEVAAAIRQYREQHMRDWLDQSIPALDGHTPREAAKMPRVRRKLETLLKEIDQDEARYPEEQRIDLRWLREVLGFS